MKRLVLLAIAVILLAYVVMATGCASLAQGASEVSVPMLTIENARSHDLTDPHFYVVGNGRYPLGIIADGSTRRHPIDPAWFGPDGCLTIVAHYVGGGDWESERVCYRPGESIDVTLMPKASESSAWSHR